jgi:hypothetical protein
MADTVAGMKRWQFFSQELDLWCDGQAREIRAGVDYPHGVADEVVIQRLKVAARRRFGSCRAWVHEGAVCFVMLPPGQRSATGRLIRPGE